MFNLTPQERNVALFLVITLAIGSGVLFFKNKKSFQIKPELLKAELDKEAKEEIIIVHLAGAVFQPGLYRVKKGTRIGEVVKETNLKAEADISNINLARLARDGEKIFIPFKSARAQVKTTAAQKNLENLSSSIITDTQSQFININQAEVLQLSRLPGIGEVLARRIVEFRRDYGLFKTKEEVKKVKGIGEKRFEKIKNLISLN